MSPTARAGMAMAALMTAIAMSSAAPNEAEPRRVIIEAADGLKEIRNLPLILAERLGYFTDEGILVTLIDARLDMPRHGDPLAAGKVDGIVEYYQHVFFVRGEGVPVESVVVMGITPNLTLLVANRLKDQVKTLADLRGKKIIIGHTNRSGKSMVGCWLPLRGGVAASEFTPVRLTEEDNDRVEQRRRVADALANGGADLVIAQEPDAGIYQASGVASVFADVTSVEETKKNLGTLFPSTALYMTNSYVKAHPDVVQHLVNALVRTLKYINSHTPDELMALVPKQFMGPDTATYARSFRHEVQMFATDGLMPDEAARKTQEIMANVMPEYRAVDLGATYTNEFARAALKNVR